MDPGDVLQAGTLGAISQRLDAYYTEAEQELWWTTVHPQLGTTPAKAANDGRVREIWLILDRLDALAYL